MNAAIPLRHMQWLALDSLDRLEWFQISGQHLLWKNMESQNVNKLLLTLWLHQLCQRTSRECCKGFVGWSKHCERTWRAQSVCQVSCYNSSHQSGQIFDRLGQLDNVGFFCSLDSLTQL